MPQDDQNSPNLFASPKETEAAQPSPDGLLVRIPDPVPSKVGPLTIGANKTGAIQIFIDERLCYNHRIPFPTFKETHTADIDGVRYDIVVRSRVIRLRISVLEDEQEIWNGWASYNLQIKSKILFIYICIGLIILFAALFLL